MRKYNYVQQNDELYHHGIKGQNTLQPEKIL